MKIQLLFLLILFGCINQISYTQLQGCDIVLPDNTHVIKKDSESLNYFCLTLNSSVIFQNNSVSLYSYSDNKTTFLFSNITQIKRIYKDVFNLKNCTDLNCQYIKINMTNQTILDISSSNRSDLASDKYYFQGMTKTLFPINNSSKNITLDFPYFILADDLILELTSGFENSTVTVHKIIEKDKIELETFTINVDMPIGSNRIWDKLEFDAPYIILHGHFSHGCPDPSMSERKEFCSGEVSGIYNFQKQVYFGNRSDVYVSSKIYIYDQKLKKFITIDKN